MYNIIPLFPTLVYHTNINNNIDALIDYCYEQKRKDDVGSTYEQRSGVNSYQSLYLNTTLLQPVRDKVDEILREVYTQPIYHNSNWININPTGSRNVQHTHPGADYSAVYYLKNTDKTGIVFINPVSHTSHNITTYTNPKLVDDTRASPQFRIEPSQGDLLLFPSYLPHWVEENKGTDDRISISWNINMVIDSDRTENGNTHCY